MLLFLDFSGGEFLLVAVVFLMFFGSKSLPGAAKALGKAVREFKEAANSVQREIEEGVKMEEKKPDQKAEQKPLAPPSIPQEKPKQGEPNS